MSRVKYQIWNLKFRSVLIICALVFGSFIGIFSFENDNISVEAATLIVGPGQTYTTIQSAIDAAGSGDTIYVYNGTYKENLVINKNITLIGNGSKSTIIDGKGPAMVIRINSNDVKISGFTVKNSNIGNHGILLNSVQNCVITNNNISSNGVVGIYLFQSFGNNISGNNIENNGIGFINMTEPCGIYLHYSYYNILSENVIINNNGSGIRLFYSNYTTITKNIIQDNHEGIFWESSDTDNVIYFNDFINNTNHVAGFSGSRIWNSFKSISYVYNTINFTRYLGNYWDNYTGKDTNGDGIGETPYNMTSDKDYFPLMKPIENYVFIPTSIKIEMDATRSNFTDKTVSLKTQEATLNASITGDFNGTINVTKLELVIINSSSFMGSGFFKAAWTAKIQGKPYNGTWQGMLFNKIGDRKIYLKGTVFGGLQGITDGYFLESINGSGNYDLYNSTWTISHIGTYIVFAKLTLNGSVDYQTFKESPTLIYILQGYFKGKSKGYYNGSLDVVLTHVCINNKTNKYHGEGFSYITYVSTYGTGTGWTYDRNVSKETVKLTGWFTDPLWGIILGTLYDGEQQQSVSISMLKVDTGLPPRPLIKVVVWARNRYSPGQTVKYLLEYRNYGLKPANNTDIIMVLPDNTTYISNTDDGIYINSTHEVIWRRNISEKSKGIVGVNCKVKWGLRLGTKLVCKGIVLDYVKNKTLASHSHISLVVIAADPNLKYGPEGNVTPGQKLNYTLEYENIGKGIAFGVYFTDELSVLLNDSSLEIGPVISTSNASIIAPPGLYNPGTRTIIWLVGEVGPGEGGYANISINVTEDAPHTSVILNYGTVYFPSVPEETRTNGIFSMVWINQGPIANAGKDITVNTLQTITFDASNSYDIDGFIMNYTWSFGDGYFGYGKVTTHSYSDDGVYTVNLTVKDDKGLISYHEITLTVLNRNPEAKLEADLIEVLTNENVTFSASKSSDLDGTISDYYFDFGDGSNSGWVQTTQINHKYAHGTNVYTAKLQVKDDDGAISTNIAELQITVNNREPIPKLFVLTIEANTYQDIWCGANSSIDLDGYIDSYYFDFGDGENTGWITKPWAIHQYTDGTKEYTISLKVKDNFGAESSIVSTVEVLIYNRKPVAKLTVSHPCIDTLDEVTLDGSESYDLDGAEIEYYFDFGDESNSGWITESIVKHTYTTGTREYLIELNVRDSDDETDTVNFTITVANRPPIADAGPDQNVHVYETVTFDGSNSYDLDGLITSYRWNFGDGSTSGWITTASTTHFYSKTGTYEVTLTVSDGEEHRSDECQITVSELEISAPVITPNFPTTIELNEDFGGWSIRLTDYEFHTNVDYVYDDLLKWYVTGNTGTIVQIRGDNRTGDLADKFEFTSILDQYGTEEITYHLYDPDGMEATINQTVVVHPINDHPVITLMSETIINVNEELSLDLEENIDDVDTSFNDLIILTDDPEHAKVDGASLLIQYDEIGEYSVLIQVKDDDLTVDHKLIVTVINPDDRDNDGLPDTWEEEYGLNPNDPGDAKLDIDYDFLSNIKEYQKGTDPTKYDTDGDGLNDRVDPYPNDSTLPARGKSSDNPVISTQLLIIIIVVIVIILILGISASIVIKNRNKRPKKPFDDFELVRNIRDDIIQGKEVEGTELSDVEIGSILSKNYQNGEISEETYRLLEEENLNLKRDAENNNKN